MRSNTLITAFALASVAVAAPVPNDPVTDMFTKISDLIGSPFGNGNGNGNGNTAGVGNDGNGAGNGVGNLNGNGNDNTFGNGNNILSGNSGIGRRTESHLPQVDSITKIIEGLMGSPFGNGNGNGNDNVAGADNDENGSNNGQDNLNHNGNGNVFGNGNGILSGNSGIGKKVRRQELPPGSLSLVPEQTLDALNKVFSQAFTDLPDSVKNSIIGALTGDNTPPTSENSKAKRQLVLTGLGDVIAQTIGKAIP